LGLAGLVVEIRHYRRHHHRRVHRSLGDEPSPEPATIS